MKLPKNKEQSIPTHYYCKTQPHLSLQVIRIKRREKILED